MGRFSTERLQDVPGQDEIVTYVFGRVWPSPLLNFKVGLQLNF